MFTARYGLGYLNEAVCAPKLQINTCYTERIIEKKSAEKWLARGT
jgi:hypothetical protein